MTATVSIVEPINTHDLLACATEFARVAENTTGDLHVHNTDIASVFVSLARVVTEYGTGVNVAKAVNLLFRAEEVGPVKRGGVDYLQLARTHRDIARVEGLDAQQAEFRQRDAAQAAHPVPTRPGWPLGAVHIADEAIELADFTPVEG